MRHEFMRSCEASSRPGTPASGRQPRPAALLALVMLALALAGCAHVAQPTGTAPAPATQPTAGVIAASELEEKWGARVNLIAVTAAGGMVDFRMKILDATRAEQLLQGHVPAIMVNHSGAMLAAPADSRQQNVRLKDGEVIFILYPNTGNALKAGDEVTVIFGDVRLGPIAAR